MFPDSVINEIKRQANLVDMVSGYGISLRPVSGGYVALCPLHRESTPSFRINTKGRNESSWHCFGCNIGGDAISFFMTIEVVSFSIAIRRLAEQYGVSLDSPRQSRPAARYMAELKEHASFWWAEQRCYLVSVLEDACADFFAASEAGQDVTAAGDWAVTCGRLLRHADALSPETRGQIFLRLRTEADVRRWRKSTTSLNSSLQWLMHISASNPGPVGRLVHTWAERIQ